MAPLFHIAFPAQELAKTKAYYVEGLGCKLGRENRSSAIFNFQGHQLVAHLAPADPMAQEGIYPRHFGLVFETEPEWHLLLARARQKQLTFYREPQCRFQGSVLEHLSFFLIDPAQNLLEFKHYSHSEAIFGAEADPRIGDASPDRSNELL